MAKSICSVQGCNDNLLAKGLCNKHYIRLTDEQMRQEIRWQAEMMECAEESAEATQND